MTCRSSGPARPSTIHWYYKADDKFGYSLFLGYSFVTTYSLVLQGRTGRPKVWLFSIYLELQGRTGRRSGPVSPSVARTHGCLTIGGHLASLSCDTHAENEWVEDGDDGDRRCSGRRTRSQQRRT
jgi:hypothetical protein